MKYPTVKVVHNRRRTATETKPATVEIEVFSNKRQKRLSTGVSVLPNQWDAVKWVVNHPDSAALNMRIEAMRRPIADYISLLMVKGEEFTFEGLEAVLAKKKHSGSFLDFVKDRIESRTDIKEVTKKNHKRLQNALEAFKQIQTFDDLTPQKIRLFDEWLHEQSYVQTTVAAYHKFMKNYIHEAMAAEAISSDPYAGIRIEKGKHKQRKYLTEEDLDRIRAFETEDKSIMRARDLFLFQCFTGLAYADMAKFDFENVTERDGKYIIRDTRQKSEEEYYLVILSPALEILKKYNFKLPIISNQKYNAALKAVAAGASIKFNVTSHVGRHTFATYCLNNGVRIETLAAMLGHSNIKTTQIYARMVNKTVESAFDGLESTLKG